MARSRIGLKRRKEHASRSRENPGMLTNKKLRKLHTIHNTIDEESTRKTLKVSLGHQTTKSRSTTPQRVFYCSPKRPASKSPNPFAQKKSLPETMIGGEHGNKPSKHLAKILRSCVSPASLKKKSPIHLEKFTIDFKKKSKKQPLKEKVHETKASNPLIKNKKKKKNSTSHGGSVNGVSKHKHLRDSHHKDQNPVFLKSKLESKHQSLFSAVASRKNSVGSRNYSHIKESNATLLNRSKLSERMTLLDIVDAAATLIQKNVRGYLCRLNLARFLKSVLESVDVKELNEKVVCSDMTPEPSNMINMKPINSISSSQSSSFKRIQPIHERSFGEIDPHSKREYVNYTPIKSREPVASLAMNKHKEVLKVTKEVATSYSNKKMSIGTQVVEAIVELKKLETIEIKESTPKPQKVNKEVQTSIQTLPDDTKKISGILENSQSRIKLDNFVKDEYYKWAQIEKLLNQLGPASGKNGVSHVSNILKKIEQMTKQTKGDMKKDFKVLNSVPSLVSIHNPNTFGTIQISEPSNLQFDNLMFNCPPKVVQGGSPLTKVKQIGLIDKWPEVEGFNKQGSLKLSTKKSVDGAIFESIDDKMVKFIMRQGTKGRSGSFANWTSDKEEEGLSESVLRSMAERDSFKSIEGADTWAKQPYLSHNLSNRRSKGTLDDLMNPLNKDQSLSDASLGDESINTSSVDLKKASLDDKSLRIPIENNPHTPITPDVRKSPALVMSLLSFDTEENQGTATAPLQLLQKTKSKKSISKLNAILSLDSVPIKPSNSIECILEACYIPKSIKKVPSLQEINIALQTILDDFDELSPSDIEMINSNRRDEGDTEMWNFSTPGETERDTSKSNVETNIKLTRLKSEEVSQDSPRKNDVKESAKHKNEINLQEKFDEIDDLLCYDGSSTEKKPQRETKIPIPDDQTDMTPVSGYDQSPRVKNNQKKEGTVLPDLEPEESDSETVYGIRTNFNAVNEYLGLLMKFLKEREPELNLPVHKNTKEIVLRRVHNLETQLKECEDNDQPVKSITIPRRYTKRNPNLEKCFKLPMPPDSLITAELFNTLEEDILSSYKEMNIMDELFDMQRIYHRAIYDCFSEGLVTNIYSNQLTLKECMAKDHKPKETENWLDKAKDWVLECATFLAGIIKDKEDSMMGSIRYMEDQFIEQLREERMFRMITLANHETGKEWGSKGDYEIILKNQIAEGVLEMLAGELVTDLQKIQSRSKG